MDRLMLKLNKSLVCDINLISFICDCNIGLLVGQQEIQMDMASSTQRSSIS